MRPQIFAKESLDMDWGHVGINQTVSNSLFVMVYDCLQYNDVQKLASLRVILAEDFNHRKTFVKLPD